MIIKNKAGEIVKAGCVIVEDGKVLLITTKNRDVWAFPKGHAESDETMEQVALRETLEETGYEVKLLKRLDDLTYINHHTNEPIRVAMFLASPIKKVKDDNDEIAEWQTITKAKELVLPNIKQYLDRLN